MTRMLLPALLVCSALGSPQTSPIEQFGHEIGADYMLVDYDGLVEYWKRLEVESDRIKVVPIGETEEGRTQYMAIISSPENLQNLDRYRQISHDMALAEGIDAATADQLAEEGKAVIWIDGGLHASELLTAQMLIETAWQIVSNDDPETNRILDDVIVLLVHANPDGQELCVEWYMRNPVPEDRTSRGVPRLYQKYIGHDNNRDSFASTQSETENLNRVMYREWLPQIMYNHHQSGPRGTVMFAPPFRDPFAYETDALVRTGLDLVSAAMHNRFIAEGKGGVTMRTGASYSAWWNGGLRTTAYFHNIIGILTETIGRPEPIEIPYIASRQFPSQDLPMPVTPQTWHLRQSVDYSMTANYAILDYASRYKKHLLMNIWRMGRNQIEKGRTDSWVPNPRVMEGTDSLSDIHTPERRVPNVWIVPADQPDYSTATKFIEALLETGVKVLKADGEFTHDGETYPAGSYVVPADQAFRPHVISMFEPQHHPDDFAYPGAPPTPPYDMSGWTPAFTMGVEVERSHVPFNGELPQIHLAEPTIDVDLYADAEGYLIDGRVNDAFTAMNRLLADGVEVLRILEGDNRGDFWVEANSETQTTLRQLARTHGVRSEVADEPEAETAELRATRIALLDVYGGSMSSGWTRWILEQFEFPFDVLYPPQIDAGELEGYDALILVDGMTLREEYDDSRLEDIPEPWDARQGELSQERSLPKLREFLEEGGTIVTIGSATRLAELLELPVESALANDDGEPVGREEFFVPGSILRVSINNDHPLAMGMPEEVDVIFSGSPAFTISGGERLAWYGSATPLRSGWAWGQEHLEGATAMATFEVGEGRVVLFGPEVAFRAQPHGTFKLLFNALLW